MRAPIRMRPENSMLRETGSSQKTTRWVTPCSENVQNGHIDGQGKQGGGCRGLRRAWGTGMRKQC